MPEIRMPRLNSNDTTYILVEWLAADGQHVRLGDPVAVLETSKATEELVAEADGYMQRIAAEGVQFGIGDLIALQFDTEAEREDYLARRPDGPGAETQPNAAPAFVLTDAARALVAQHKISELTLTNLNQKIIKGADVEALIAQRSATPDGDLEKAISRQQRAVAAVVSASHREIPAAFPVMRVYVDAAFAFVERLRAEQRAVVGIPELLVRALGVLGHEFPQFYVATSSARTDVGVTIDTGTGLFIPVVRAVAELSLAEISATMMEFRKKASRRAFRAEELAGAGDIVLSLSHEPDVVLAQTIIYPQHAGMLSVGGVMTELQFDPDGAVVQRHYVNLCLTFDHRAANGRDAVAYLRRIKDLIERTDALTLVPELS